MSKTIHHRICDILTELEPIQKSHKPESGPQFKYRKIEQFINALNPLLAKHRVFIVPMVVEHKSTVYTVHSAKGERQERHTILLVEYGFHSEHGDFIKVGPIAAEAVDGGDKGVKKALGSALKDMLTQVFMVPTESDASKEPERYSGPRTQSGVSDDKPRATIAKPKTAYASPGQVVATTGPYANMKLSDAAKDPGFVAWIEEKEIAFMGKELASSDESKVALLAAWKSYALIAQSAKS